MTVKCKQCGSEFTAPDIANHRMYCSSKCRKAAFYEKKKREYQMAKTFAAEWEAWKQDFMERKRSGAVGKKPHATD